MALNTTVRAPRHCVARCSRCDDEAAAADLLFLEYWQTQRCPDIAASLRASQIRRANPALAAEIHAELTRR